jgi:L-seryl-tRNA(Ser) seleniumtransferase
VALTGVGAVVDSEAVPGAGSAPGVTMPSVAVRLQGDHLAALRRAEPPIVARTRDGATLLDLRTIDPADDAHVARSIAACAVH